MRLRRLNDEGIERLESFLDSLTTDSPQPIPMDVLSDGTTSEPVALNIELEQRSFANRFELATYLHSTLGDAEIGRSARDRGLWAWIAMFYFDQLCPPDQAGRRKPGERARWIPATGNFRKYYRHLVAGPLRIYRTHRDSLESALVVLCTPPHQPGDIVEQLAARQELVTNRSILGAATTLYVDPDTNRPKRGAAGRGPGSARRLAEVVGQFDITWDLYSMDASEILSLLPAEFDRFRPE